MMIVCVKLGSMLTSRRNRMVWKINRNKLRSKIIKNRNSPMRSRFIRQ